MLPHDYAAYLIAELISEYIYTILPLIAASVFLGLVGEKQGQ